MQLHNVRVEYTKHSLSKSHCLPDPLEQFQQWLNEAMAAQVQEPTAMNLASVKNGKPSSRVVLLKELNQHGLVFFTNYQSRKGQSISDTPFVALNFFWPELERQIRIEGKIEKLPASSSDDYFFSRPYASRIGAWASQQSQVIINKHDLLTRTVQYTFMHPDQVPRPDHWGGYVVIPEYVEFWQGRPSRLHDRICYQLGEDGLWGKAQRLAP